MSSATFHPEARTALRAKLKLVPNLPVEAWEGFAFTPKQGVPFIEDKLQVDADLPRAHGAIEHRISYIITLKYPSDDGTAAIEAMAGALLDQFKVGTVLTSGSTSLLCMKAERQGAILQEQAWAVLTVRVTISGFTLD